MLAVCKHEPATVSHNETCYACLRISTAMAFIGVAIETNTTDLKEILVITVFNAHQLVSLLSFTAVVRRLLSTVSKPKTYVQRSQTSHYFRP